MTSIERRYSAAELRIFLAAVDQFLTAPVRLILIGGSALILGYGVADVTKDVDTFNEEVLSIPEALAKARELTRLAIPIGPAGVGELPLNHEDRLRREMTSLEHLVVLVPEKHDLALSKL